MAAKQIKRKGKAEDPGIARLFDQGLALHKSGRLAEAGEVYRKILEVNPKHSDSLHLLGMVSYAGGDVTKALELIGKAVELQPRADIYLGNLGNVLRSAGRLDEAIERYRQAVAANPQNPTPISNLGNALGDMGRLEEAVAQYQRALELRPDFYEALFNIGLTLRSLGQFERAIANLRKATEYYPDLAEAHYTLGQVLLLHGELEAGWREYDWRWRLDEYLWLKDIHGEFTQPRWFGESLQDKTILVYAEQGMGDALQFVRYLPRLVERGARVVFAVHPRLMRVLGTYAGVTMVPLDGVPLPPFDFHSPLLSLPRVLGMNRVEDIPAQAPYLFAEAERIARWRERLSKLPGFKIGIAWQGNPNARIDKGRSPPLAAFAPLAELPGVTLVSLQQRDGLDQLERLPPGMQVERLGVGVDEVGAFVDTAAIMECLDLVIVSDSAIAHLAGGLGRPVWLPLKQIPDWRFFLEREDSPWYPTMRLFRQHTDGDWEGVFRDMAAVLRRQHQLGGAEMAKTKSGTAAKEQPLVPVSWGEIIDKITILEIKNEQIKDAGKLANIRRELAELVAVREAHFPAHRGLAALSAKLKGVNESLWWIEDDIRDCERAKDFGAKFIELARAVYVTNDLRGGVKREINDLLGSNLVEEKSYAAYTDNQEAASADMVAKLKAAGDEERLQRDYSRLGRLLDEAAAWPAPLNPLDSVLIEQVATRLATEGVLRAGQRILDMNCADGAALLKLSALGGRPIGIGSPAQVANCRASGLEARVMDPAFLAFGDAEFDLVWARNTLQRSALPYVVLRECRRVLKAGGHLYAEVPAPDTVLQHQAQAANLSVPGQTMWQALFQRAGFTLVWGLEYKQALAGGSDAQWSFLLRAA